LRAWVEPDPDEPPDAVALDDFALRVLGLAPGERVWLRLLTPNGRVPSPGATIDPGSS